MIFGIYEELIYAFLGFFKNVKSNFKFLFPIVSGAIVGIIIFGNILKYLFFAYPIQIKFVFIGLILGSIPKLIKEVKKKNNFKLIKKDYSLKNSLFFIIKHFKIL